MSFDLTPNRIFSSPIKRSFNFFPDKKTNIPWEGIENVPYERKRFKVDDSLFRIGTVEDIRFKKEMTAMENGSMCECCGKQIHRFPWSENQSCLCNPCLKRLKENCGADIWGFEKKKENPELTHPWWFYI